MRTAQHPSPAYPVRMRPLLPVAAVLLASACRVITSVEVETRVEADGSGVRTLLAVSRWEDGRPDPSQLPQDFLPPAAAYAVQAQEAGRIEASAAFASLEHAPAPFAFGYGAHRTAFDADFRAVDWGLFTLVHYAEFVVDAADPETLRTALDEVVAVALDAGDAACAEIFGADFDATRLHERLRGDLRAACRDIALIVWQEVYAQNAGVEALLQRALPRLKRLGLELDPRWFVEWEEGYPRIRAAVAGWVERQLLAKREGARIVQPVGLESTLFDGPFAAAFQRALAARFGSPEAAREWWKNAEQRLKGSFGGGRDDVTFRLRVRMPGTLLRTDGWIEADGATFLEFPGSEAFPRGRGIRCASVVWRGETLSALAGAPYPDNSTAIGWTRLLGSGPEGEPNADLLALVKECIAARGRGPLEEAAEDPEHPRAADAARVLAWLRGEG